MNEKVRARETRRKVKIVTQTETRGWGNVGMEQKVRIEISKGDEGNDTPKGTMGRDAKETERAKHLEQYG